MPSNPAISAAGQSCWSPPRRISPLNRAIRLKNPRLVLQHRRLVDRKPQCPPASSGGRPERSVRQRGSAGHLRRRRHRRTRRRSGCAPPEAVWATRCTRRPRLITVRLGQIGVGQPCPGGTRRRRNTLANSSRISGLVAAVSTARAPTPARWRQRFRYSQVSPAVRRRMANRRRRFGAACHAT